MLNVGDQAPDFTAGGGSFRLSEVNKDKNVVLFFYPGDFTPICTKESCHFRDHSGEYEKLDTVLIGISKDDEETHRKFAEQYRLNFTLLSDPDGKIGSQYGLGERKFLIVPVRRITYVIEKGGKVKGVIHKELSGMAHVEESLQILKGMQSPYPTG